MKRALLILGVACLLLSCAPTMTMKDGKPVERAQIDKDRSECMYEARKAMASRDQRDAVGNAIDRNLLADECMKVRGYTRVKAAQ